MTELLLGQECSSLKSTPVRGLEAEPMHGASRLNRSLTSHSRTATVACELTGSR